LRAGTTSTGASVVVGRQRDGGVMLLRVCGSRKNGRPSASLPWRASEMMIWSQAVNSVTVRFEDGGPGFNGGMAAMITITRPAAGASGPARGAGPRGYPRRPAPPCTARGAASRAGRDGAVHGVDAGRRGLPGQVDLLLADVHLPGPGDDHRRAQPPLLLQRLE